MGHLGSAVYIGAIALGGTIFSVLYSFFSFLRAGTTGFTAQSLGKGNNRYPYFHPNFSFSSPNSEIKHAITRWK